MARISAVIAAHNEEQRIAACLASVAWADEIIVVDGSSDDCTAALAAVQGARVLVRPNQVIPEINKNVGLDAATGDWILSLDADERIPAALAEAVRAFAAAPAADVALRMARQNYMLGVWSRHGRWPDYQIRFFRRGAARFQEILHRQPTVEGSVRTLPARPELAIGHYPSASLSDHLKSMDRYTTSEAETLHAQGVRFSWQRIALYPVAVFLREYLAQRGFLDGAPGFILSVWSFFYAFLTWAKLWELTSGGQRRSAP
jgi:hypothetical protein